MEPTEAPLKIVHAVRTTVFEVKACWGSNVDEWVHFEGSRESMLFPIGAFAVGDQVKITFEKE